MLLYCSVSVSVRDWESDNNNQGDYVCGNKDSITSSSCNNKYNKWVGQQHNSQCSGIKSESVQWYYWAQWLNECSQILLTYTYIDYKKIMTTALLSIMCVLLWKQTSHMLLLLFLS